MSGNFSVCLTCVGLLRQSYFKVKHLRRGDQGAPSYRPNCFTGEGGAELVIPSEAHRLKPRVELVLKPPKPLSFCVS